MQQENQTHDNRLAALALGALGIVYGDIGTSPLYTMKEVFAGTHPMDINEVNVLSILSLIFWSLVFVVSVKYVAFIMRADNRGEGGIMALMAVAMRTTGDNPKKGRWILALGIFGAALFYGDGVITPAISVLSAVEGIQIAAPGLKSYIIPVTLAVLILLFSFQKHGTAKVGALFGPVMLLWFSTLALLGMINILHDPSVFRALNPLYAIHFITAHKTTAFLALGGVVLAITGAEACYADMGHFGRKPIQVAWFSFVLPALTLNYFGQGALLLHDAKAIENPFYLLAPSWALYPLVFLATVATVIASQAVISGAFSITKQAMQLGYSPRVAVVHTSEESIGQIYLPAINWLLLCAIIVLVINFKSSANLGAAYGLAVTGTMIIDSILAFIVVRRLWGWNWLLGSVVIGFFMIIDWSFFSANAIKIADGGWVPLAMAAFAYTLMSTWKRGRRLQLDKIREEATDLVPFIKSLEGHPPHRVEGMAVFMTTHPEGVPHALLHNLYHNQVLHDTVLLLTSRTEDVPHIPEAERVKVEHLDAGFHRVLVRYGFKDDPDIPAALELCSAQGIEYEPMRTSFFLGRDTLVPKRHSKLPYWREKLYIWMFRNSGTATAYFKIPTNRVIELGTQIEL